MVRIDVPRSFRDGEVYALWQAGGPGRLLGQLARDHASGESTLTPIQLAALVELFREDPLPESLRIAVVEHLRGKRLRRQGARPKRSSALAQVELAMLPGAYAEALTDAEVERARLRAGGKKRARHGEPDRLPTTTSIACALVRTRLPSLAGLTDRALMNLVSKEGAKLLDAAGERRPSPRRRTR